MREKELAEEVSRTRKARDAAQTKQAADQEAHAKAMADTTTELQRQREEAKTALEDLNRRSHQQRLDAQEALAKAMADKTTELQQQREHTKKERSDFNRLHQQAVHAFTSQREDRDPVVSPRHAVSLALLPADDSLRVRPIFKTFLQRIGLVAYLEELLLQCEPFGVAKVVCERDLCEVFARAFPGPNKLNITDPLHRERFVRAVLSSKQFIKTQFLVFFARKQIGAPRRGTLGDVVRLFFELKMYVFVI